MTPSSSGEGGIRTLDDPEAIPVFETGAFSRSATSPWWCVEPFGGIRMNSFSSRTAYPEKPFLSNRSVFF